MYLYLLSQDVNGAYDTYDSAVVSAKNEEEAITIHPDVEQKETLSKCDSYDSWVSLSDVSVKCIGKTKEPKGVICSSYNAG